MFTGPGFDTRQMLVVDRTFATFSTGDADMVTTIHQLAGWLSERAATTLHLFDRGDVEGAKKLIRDARIEALPMRQKLARTVSGLRDVQAELARAAVTKE